MTVVIKKPIAPKVDPANENVGLTAMQQSMASLSLLVDPDNDDLDEEVAVEPDELDELAQEIDDLGAMESVIAGMKKQIAEHGKRLSVVRDKLVDMQMLVKTGDHYYAQVKETGNQVRTVKDMPLAIKHLGVETFLQVAKVSLSDIDKYLNDAQKAEVIETSESTTRSMKIMKRV